MFAEHLVFSSGWKGQGHNVVNVDVAKNNNKKHTNQLWKLPLLVWIDSQHKFANFHNVGNPKGW